ncbi:MAG: Hpt domain-containing protein [Candidatus Competibacteraceae bacterium]
MHDTDCNLLPLLDAAVLAELREVMEDDFADLISTFLRDAPQQFSAIQTAIIQHDASHLYQAAHKFKSSCGSIGAARLADLIRRLELAGRQNRLDDTVELLQHAQTIASATFNDLQAQLEPTVGRRQ